MKTNIFRNDRVHVQRAMCPTCIYRPGSPISRERVAEMQRDADRDGSTIVCHETLDTKAHAACRGYFDAGCSQSLQIADRLGFVEWVREVQ